MTNTKVKRKEAHIFTVTKFFFVVLYSENVRRPWKEWFVPKYISAESVSESVSESESESEKNFCGSESEKKVFASTTLTENRVNESKTRSEKFQN
jgi:hypothetical protein